MNSSNQSNGTNVVNHSLTLARNGGEVPADMTEIAQLAGVLLQRAASLFLDGASRAQHFREQSLALQQQTLVQASKSEQTFQEFVARLSRMEQTLAQIQIESKQMSTSCATLIPRLGVLDHNLDQIRILTEDTTQKLKVLVEDFIERHVTDHLFREFARLEAALRNLAAEDPQQIKPQLADFAEGIELFLLESELRVINPPPGTTFDPREHNPLDVVTTQRSDLDGTLSHTFSPGLARKSRVVQMANVAVFKFVSEPNKK